MKEVEIVINGKKIKAKQDQNILQVASSNGIWIPSLCYHESLSPYGACRLCIVEVELNGEKKIVTSCTTKIEKGMKINTDTAEIRQIRKALLELLLARCPNVKIVRDIAQACGVYDTPYPLENNFCILCGLCVRVCREIVGANAISFSKRGPNREVVTPFLKASEDCIGCGSCVYICPTGVITMQDIKDTIRFYPDGKDNMGPHRIMKNWKTTLPLKRCKQCGNPFATQRQLEFFAKNFKVREDFFEICPNCREKAVSPKKIK